ncbi:transglycosylase domain-containing protein [Streptomyces sp. ST2-7A]|uniref:transglycosylase domain-containing protein n=1 Tax=Streptomyces sp. ST2-7A TaxID=2907214 RepID=UPI001F3B95CD|nr:transglycosylase domain-containing protein [Streptomyces sp. ST2-7A]MCE7082901.1 transglycosylase domain-containing protein [Streptomyces sp. ST2-7A]
MGAKRPGGGLTTAQQAAKFLGVSVLAGAVLAGLALPAVGSLGLAAKTTIEGFDELPVNLTRPPLSQKTTILDSEGGKIAEVYARNRTVVSIEEMSPYLLDGIVAIEDARFYEHGAIDLRGVLRALNRNLEEGGTTEGASTLTQQYVKNVFVEAAGDDPEAVAAATQQTIGRKIRELKYAIQVEEELGKDQILENYLNITFFGQQAYGVEAASQRYFSKPAADLELHEAALLAGLVQSPSRYDPVSSPDEALKRRNTVLNRMEQVGAITAEESREARGRDLELEVSSPRNGCITATREAGFFCDYVRHEFLTNPVFGDTKENRKARWDLGGLTIRTTLRSSAQAAASQAAVAKVNPDDQVAAAITQVEPGTGHILAMAQSRPYGNDAEQNQTTINLNVSHDMLGSTYGFPPGSTFKPFVAAAALESGVSPAQVFSTGTDVEIDLRDYKTCEGTPYGTDTWEPENEGGVASGSWDMTEALGLSINTYFVLLLQEAGLCETQKLVNSMGLRGGDGEPLNITPATSLGAAETTPLDMASGYAAFANRGTYCAPIAILEVTDAEGQSLPVPETECARVMSQRTADTINMMLRGVVEEGTGQQAGLTDGRDNAGKTGTSERRRDVWFVGYTPDVSTAVRVGSDRGEPLPMYNLTIGGQFYDRATGGGLAGPIWKIAMEGALEGVPASSFNHVNVPRGDTDEADEDDGADNGGGDNSENRSGGAPPSGDGGTGEDNGGWEGGWGNPGDWGDPDEWDWGNANEGWSGFIGGNRGGGNG